MSRLRRVAKILIGLIVVLFILLGLGIAAIETGWAKNQLRQVIVRQANQYLTATLDIGSLGGSLFRGIELGDVRLSRDGRTLIAIEEITVSYSIRELLQPGVVIRRVRIVRPRVIGSKQADGRWDLGALVKRESKEQERRGPGRPIEVQAIEVVDGHVTMNAPLDFGAAHVPTDFDKLNASLAFAYYPVRWQLTFQKISWLGTKPELSATNVTGVFGRGPTGWFFDRFHVVTPRSDFRMQGVINSEKDPTEFDLQVTAARFAFQEWAGVLHGLKNIAVEAAFDTSLRGSTHALGAELRVAGTGGGIRGHVTLDTSVPGWHGAGTVDVETLELGHWLNRPDRPSDVTGRVTFDLALGLGQHFPRGSYSFDGPHAMYMNYAADNLKARGRITERAVEIASATAVAYDAHVSVTNGSIGIEEPFPYRFAGTTTAVDLRRVPKALPVPHVESVLAFDYDVTGTFSHPFIAGTATFAASEFLGARIGAGMAGSIDTSQQPIHYTGDGEIDGVNMRAFGEGLDIAWMRDPRYAGTISGHFRVDGRGSAAASLALTADGRLTRASMFHGEFRDANVTMTLEHGDLDASYDGSLTGVDPAIAFSDSRFAASLTGTATAHATVRHLLTAEKLTLDDYDVNGRLRLAGSRLHDVAIDHGAVEATLRGGTLSIAQLDLHGPAVDGTGRGTITLTEPPSTDFSFDAARLDLAQLKAITGRDLAGLIATKGHASGLFDDLHLVGEATASDLDAFDVQALTLTGTYDFTGRRGEIKTNGEFLTIFGNTIRQATGVATYDAPSLHFDFAVSQTETRQGHLTGTVAIDQSQPDVTDLAISDLTVTLGPSPWRLASGDTPPHVKWSARAIDFTPMSFLTTAGGDGRIGLSGSWRTDGSGAVKVTVSHVYLESLQGALRPARFGGVLDADITMRGTRDLPIVSGTATITAGRIERVSYQKLAVTLEYVNQMATVDIRLDQAPGVTVTAVGSIPLALFDTDARDQPIDLTVRSTSVDLGLVEGVTTVVNAVSGTARLDVHVVGTGHDPHLDGSVSVANAAFQVESSGSKYKNASVAMRLARDRITVEALHVEDNGGHPLDVHGSLGTHELRVGELELDATAKHFEVIRNELGHIDVDATLSFRGRFEQPTVTGDISINGGDLRVDEVLARTIFQPYATTPTEIAALDAVAALNPWDRLFLDVSLHVPESLRLVGNNVQISQGTPIGLGDINMRVGGDLYLYKGPAGALSITGSLDSVSGAYTFQGRRFQVVESESSINFRGDLNPDVYVTVTRTIAAVETRVTIAGSLHQPELQLSSVPPLDSSDILSLIVFNTSTNELSPSQQQELVVRAGTLAAGFLAAPIMSAIQQEIGLQVLDIEPSADLVNSGPRVTIGQELAPGLVAQFSRQFGQEAYDEATVEYYLSRILRLRATFSDAQSLEARSPFRRVERAGIDLLFFFSF